MRRASASARSMRRGRGTSLREKVGVGVGERRAPGDGVVERRASGRSRRAKASCCVRAPGRAWSTPCTRRTACASVRRPRRRSSLQRARIDGRQLRPQARRQLGQRRVRRARARARRTPDRTACARSPAAPRRCGFTSGNIRFRRRKLSTHLVGRDSSRTRRRWRADVGRARQHRLDDLPGVGQRLGVVRVVDERQALDVDGRAAGDVQLDDAIERKAVERRPSAAGRAAAGTCARCAQSSKQAAARARRATRAK